MNSNKKGGTVFRWGAGEDQEGKIREEGPEGRCGRKIGQREGKGEKEMEWMGMDGATLMPEIS